MKKVYLCIILSLVGVCGSLLPAGSARAATTPALFPPIVITEMQPGTSVSASQEFIELYNQSPAAIDLAKEGWQVQIATATALDWTKAKSVALTGILYPGRYMLLSSSYTAPGDSKKYLQDYASAQFSSGLSASSGHVRVVSTTSLASATPTEDSLEWSVKNGSGQLVSGPIAPAGSYVLSSDMSPGTSLKRVVSSEGRFKATAVVAADFALSLCPSPTATNTGPLTAAFDPLMPVPTSIDIANPLCVSVDAPAGGILPPATEPPAELLPAEAVLPPTPQAIPPQDIGLEAPQVTEILPNTASPQTDAEDEFIELYNGNAVDFDLSGFSLGTGAPRRYVFPAGTILPAHSFRAFYARETGLSLSNSGGQVLFFDPLGVRIGQTEQYGTARDGMAWALAQGRWWWTDVPTPGVMNAIHEPIMRAAARSASPKTPVVRVASAKKTATKKVASATASKKVKKAKTTKSTGVVSATEPPRRTPVHPGVLALVAGFAILYGLYEYRGDMANKFYQLRNDRAARRALRESDAGR